MKKRNCRFSKMKRNFLNILIGLTVIVTVESCTKSGTGDDGSGGPHVISPNDTTPPVVNILTPANNQVFTNGNVINITGRLTDDLGLYRGTVKVINDANGAILMNQSYEIHGLKLYDFNINYTTSVSVVSDYTITVAFEDHGSNMTTKSVKVKVNP